MKETAALNDAREDRSLERAYDRLMERSRARYKVARKGKLPVMDTETLRQLCLDREGYETPELNDNLYAHFSGFTKIEGLEKYTGLKSLWLESNGFTKLENLDCLDELRCLYISKNQIYKMENLTNLTNLVTLDISENCIEKIEGLEMLRSLQTINVAKNRLEDAQAIKGLEACPSITNADLSHNKLTDPAILHVFQNLPELRALRLTANPIVSSTSHFRKKFILGMPQLGFLDRPIFELERAQAKGWEKGGREGETEAREKFIHQKHENERKVMNDFRSWQQSIREQKRLGKLHFPKTYHDRKDLEREQEAKLEAQQERRMMQDENAVKNLGKRFWATPSAAPHSTAQSDNSDQFQPPTLPPAPTRISVERDTECTLVSSDLDASDLPPPLDRTQTLEVVQESEMDTENSMETIEIPRDEVISNVEVLLSKNQQGSGLLNESQNPLIQEVENYQHEQEDDEINKDKKICPESNVGSEPELDYAVNYSCATPPPVPVQRLTWEELKKESVDLKSKVQPEVLPSMYSVEKSVSMLEMNAESEQENDNSEILKPLTREDIMRELSLVTLH